MPALIGRFMSVHRDERRAITEFNSLEGDFSVQSFEIHQPIPLGNHYHRRRVETFIILEGGGTLTTQDVNGNVTPMGSITETKVKAGDVIWMPTHVAHTFVLDPGSKMICLSSIAFDQNDMDMVVHKLV